MATLVDGDVYVFRLYCVLADQVGINRAHVRIHTVVGLPTDADLAQDLSTRFALNLKALLVIDASFRGVGVQRRRPLPPTVEVYAVGGAGAGTAATPPLPKQVSGLITLRTNFAGRRYRGRVYPPFPSEADNESVFGRPSAGYVTRLENYGAGFVGSYAGGAAGNTYAGQLCLLNEVSGATVDITSRQARIYWASQRRRGDFGPTNISPI